MAQASRGFMSNRKSIIQFFAPPVFPEDEEKTRKARYANAIALTLMAIMLGYEIIFPITLGNFSIGFTDYPCFASIVVFASWNFKGGTCGLHPHFLWFRHGLQPTASRRAVPALRHSLCVELFHCGNGGTVARLAWICRSDNSKHHFRFRVGVR